MARRLWFSFPEFSNRENLQDLLSTGMSTQEICEYVGCTRAHFRAACGAYGVTKVERDFLRAKGAGDS